MNQEEENLENSVRAILEKLRPAPDRNLERGREMREHFLAQARLAALRANSQQPVSADAFRRLNGWTAKITHPFRNKEHRSMIAVISTLIVILALVLGGGGASVVAAQGSLPNEGLYFVKIASEEAQLRLANNEQTRINLHLAYADRRVSELASMAAAGEAAPEPVAERLENHLRLALNLAAGLDADALTPALLQIRTHMRSQERLMEMMRGDPATATDPVLARVRAMLRQQIHLVEQGIAAPQNFRNQLRYEYKEFQSTPPAPAATGNSYGAGPTLRPATQTCNTCTPAADGTGPGAGPGPLQYGQTPEPGSGPGPAATPSQAPARDPGSGPARTQAPGGGGNPEPSQEPGGQGSGSSTPGGGQGRP